MIPLRLDKYRTRDDSINKSNKRYESSQKEIQDLSVFSIKADKEMMASDSSKQARTDAWFKEIRKDIYIFEALKVLEDAQ